MKTALQIILLAACPIVVYRAIPGRSWWGVLGIIGFIFAYFWTRHAQIKREEHFIRQTLISILVTGVVTLIIMFFL